MVRDGAWSDGERLETRVVEHNDFLRRRRQLPERPERLFPIAAGGFSPDVSVGKGWNCQCQPGDRKDNAPRMHTARPVAWRRSKVYDSRSRPTGLRERRDRAHYEEPLRISKADRVGTAGVSNGLVRPNDV